ncbi:MAG: hypothetical protein WC456_02085 [Patescibacteria group bacterium]
MKILIFLQGTVIMHPGAAGKTRADIIQQVRDQEDSVRDFKNYIPIGRAPEKLRTWAEQGAEICYLSALSENKKARGDEVVGREGLKADSIVLERYGFPAGIIYHRAAQESYQVVVEQMRPLPDILIEDDCESIGGASEMTYPYIALELKEKIKSVVVREFIGIDHLPADHRDLYKT